MLQDFWVFFLTVSTGFVSAGIIGSFYTLVLNRRLSFDLVSANSMSAVVGLCALVFAGPNVIMRNAVRARLIEGRPPIWLALSTVIATIWSFMVGVFLLSILLTL